MCCSHGQLWSRGAGVQVAQSALVAGASPCGRTMVGSDSYQWLPLLLCAVSRPWVDAGVGALGLK